MKKPQPGPRFKKKKCVPTSQGQGVPRLQSSRGQGTWTGLAQIQVQNDDQVGLDCGLAVAERGREGERARETRRDSNGEAESETERQAE